MNPEVGYDPVRRGLDRAVRVTHRLTPMDVVVIVDALEVDGIQLICDGGMRDASLARITAALCGGTEEDYR